MFDSMDSDLNNVFLCIWLNVVCNVAGELQSLSQDINPATKLGMVIFTREIVHHLAMIIMLLSAVPARDDLSVQEGLEEVCSAGRVRPIDTIFEPDLTARVDRYVARRNCFGGR